MHWSLDVSFSEDNCRVRMKNAAKVFNVLRHFTLNLLSRDKSSKGGISAKRKRCAISHLYLEKIIAAI
ncbi:hypothetical protein FACS1894184_17780 [Clostridia bacterium]|nr:hypothetical protein FACS1894184_17780 [Clostridia bacterium]